MLIGLSVVTFLVVRLLPGGPAQTLVGIRANAETIASLNEQLGLNDPLVVQYLRYVSGLVTGDLGESFLTGASVDSVITAHIGSTLLLIVYSVALACIIGIPLAVVAAYSRNRLPDHVIRGVVVVSFSLPSFWVGIVLVAVFGLRLGWFPTGGTGQGLVDQLWHLFLPALTLALTFLAVLVRGLRSSLSDVVRADFVDAARLKGLSEGRILVHHVLRIALVPAVTLVGLNVSYLLGASVIVENVFAVDGIGQQLVAAVLQRDFLVVQGITITFGLLVIVVGLLVEILHVMLDPRIGAPTHD
ncbi:MAG: ABC transporter permease [Propionibacteriales bacterium]|nr:ABC transporter permease [Propionibacteriales bacterium]